MREIQNDGKGGWIEVTDHDVNNEIEYIHNELRTIRNTLIRLVHSIDDLYIQRQPTIFWEGTNKEVIEK